MTVEQMMSQLAAQDDMLLGRLFLNEYSPKLNPEKGAQYWLDAPGAPWPEITTEEKGKTMDYDEMVKKWRAGQLTF